MANGYVIRIIGIFVIWMFSGFRNNFTEAKRKFERYGFIVGLCVLAIIFYLGFKYK